MHLKRKREEKICKSQSETKTLAHYHALYSIRKYKTTYTFKIPKQEAVSFFDQIPLFSRERLHLWLLPQLVQVLLILQYRQVLYIAGADGLLFGFLVAFNGLSGTADARRVAARAR